MFCSTNRSQLIEAMMVLATPLDYLLWWLLLAGKNLMIVPSSRWVGGWMVGLCRNQWILRWARRRVIITALAKRLPSGRGPPGSCWFLWGRVSALTLVRLPITSTLTLAIAHITTSAVPPSVSGRGSWKSETQRSRLGRGSRRWVQAKMLNIEMRLTTAWKLALRPELFQVGPWQGHWFGMWATSICNEVELKINREQTNFTDWL